MAEMKGEDRGQLLLVAGVLVAVLFVALALLVNTAIYTDNVATRGGDAAGEAIEYQAGVTEAVGGLLDAENANSEHTNRGEIESALESGTESIEETIRANNLRRGAVAEIDTGSIPSTTTDGLSINETDTAAFESWEANASAVRGFVIDLDPDNMTEGSTVIDLNGTELAVNKTEGDVVVTGGTEPIECRTAASGTVRFDVTGERLDGEPCRFGWPEFENGDTIAIEDGPNAGGSYEVTIESADDPAWISAHTTEAIYSIEGLGISIDTPELRYETSVRIAPGEPDA